MALINNSKLCHQDYAFVVMAPYFGKGMAKTVGSEATAAQVCANGIVEVHNEWCRRGQSCVLNFDLPEFWPDILVIGSSQLENDARQIALMYAVLVFSHDIVVDAWQIAQSQLQCTQVSVSAKNAVLKKPVFRTR